MSTEDDILTMLKRKKVIAHSADKKFVTLQHKDLALLLDQRDAAVRHLRAVIDANADDNPVIAAALSGFHFIHSLGLDDNNDEYDDGDGSGGGGDETQLGPKNGATPAAPSAPQPDACGHPEVVPCGNHGHCRLCGAQVQPVAFGVLRFDNLKTPS